jgi:hypothetical protein
MLRNIPSNVKGQKKVFSINVTQKQTGIIILISDKANFKPKLVPIDKEMCLQLIKEMSIKKMEEL